MKGNRKFIILFSVLFVVYVIAELNRPKQIDWTVTLAKSDKNPFGGYVLYNRLKDIVPPSAIKPIADPIYNQLLNNDNDHSSAYLLLSPFFKPSKNDLDELRLFVHKGNYAFISAANFGKMMQDTFRIKTATKFTILSKDSTSVNLVNPWLKNKTNYTFFSNTIDEYFSVIDTAFTTVLGTNDRGQANFIKVNYGDGVFLFHAAPLCFSNYFLLYQNNQSYTSKVLSYLPANLTYLFWDEYYKPGGETPETPLRFILSNHYLLWALRLSLLGLLVYIFFEMKRQQRVIPVIEPLRNNSLDFVQTVSSVYFNQKDNAGIAEKKITYFFDFIRQRFFLQTNQTDDAFIEALSRKSGVIKNDVEQLIRAVNEVNNSHAVNDQQLLDLDQQIDNFYKQV